MSFVSPTRQSELDAIAKARRLALETGRTHTVWHDCAALEAIVTVGTLPPGDRAVMRVETVHP